MYPAPMLDPKSSNVLSTWHLFSKSEKKNMMIYIAGIMVYKFGLEVFVGSFISLATNRYDYAARVGTRIVLSVAILVFAVLTTLIIVDAATGVTFKPAGASLDDFSY
ncbi:hypothetical protein VE02_09742 [Pseudogymnoascus sp. 03VT05]|nr:hypothetical protein VE02_09742 [Pseudogymnoascus sp. 03VT05]